MSDNLIFLGKTCCRPPNACSVLDCDGEFELDSVTFNGSGSLVSRSGNGCADCWNGTSLLFPTTYNREWFEDNPSPCAINASASYGCCTTLSRAWEYTYRKFDDVPTNTVAYDGPYTLPGHGVKQFYRGKQQFWEDKGNFFLQEFCKMFFNVSFSGGNMSVTLTVRWDMRFYYYKCSMQLYELFSYLWWDPTNNIYQCELDTCDTPPSVSCSSDDPTFTIISESTCPPYATVGKFIGPTFATASLIRTYRASRAIIDCEDICDPLTLALVSTVTQGDKTGTWSGSGIKTFTTSVPTNDHTGYQVTKPVPVQYYYASFPTPSTRVDDPDPAYNPSFVAPNDAYLGCKLESYAIQEPCYDPSPSITLSLCPPPIIDP